MNGPAITRIQWRNTHRLIPSKYGTDGESVLVPVADDEGHLREIFDLDHATDDRPLAENDRLPGVGVDELMFGVPRHRIVNFASFFRPHIKSLCNYLVA